MKKVLKEWKKWINETKATEKYFGDVPRHLSTISPRDQGYNRAVTSMMGQGDFRSTFKVWLGQFMKNAKRAGQIEALVERMSEQDRAQAIRDLNIMRYIYSGKSDFETVDTGHEGLTGTIYDNQPEVTGSAVEKIDFVLDQLGTQPSFESPSVADQEEVYIYYIKPNYQAAKGDTESAAMADTFRKNIAMSQTSDFMKRQAELDALNRQREIERKRELARRRRERRRNK